MKIYTSGNISMTSFKFANTLKEGIKTFTITAYDISTG